MNFLTSRRIDFGIGNDSLPMSHKDGVLHNRCELPT
jgi:hypothetical protein